MPTSGQRVKPIKKKSEIFPLRFCFISFLFRVVGFWQWMPCAKGEKFYFSEQRCLTTPPANNQRVTSSSNLHHTKNGIGKVSTNLHVDANSRSTPAREGSIGESPPHITSPTTTTVFTSTVATTVASTTTQSSSAPAAVGKKIH